VAGAGVAVTRLELARQVVDEYIAVLHAEAQRAIVLATNERLADLVRGLESRVREGISAEGDLRRLEAERARVGFALARLDVQREAANLRLCMWLGLTPCADLQLALPVAPAPRPDLDALAALVEATPGVAEARASVAAARAQQALADVVTRPDLTITSGYKRVQGTPTAVAGLSVTVPLFDRNVADRRRFAARSASAEHVLEAVVRRTRADLEARLALARRLETEASLAQARAVVPAEVSTRAAESAFREGAAELLRVLDAHRTASDVARDVVDLRLDALRASLLLRLELSEEIP
jgi:cobalt-zinc-cadmium efflux system outer membrane protein